jgi:hypothetical protein
MNIFIKSVEKVQVSLKSEQHSGYVTWRFMYIYDNFSLSSSQNEKCFRQTLHGKSKHTFHVLKLFFPESCRLWNNVKKYVTAGQATDDNIIWRMCFAHWIKTATDTNSEYVILTAFPRQQWLRERASMLRYTYTACRFFSETKWQGTDIVAYRRGS